MWDRKKGARQWMPGPLFSFCTLQSKEREPRVVLQHLPVRFDQLLHRRRPNRAAREYRHPKRGRVRLPAMLDVIDDAGDVEIHERDSQRPIYLRAGPTILLKREACLVER